MDELRTALRDAANAAGQQAHPDFAAVINRAHRRRTGIRVMAATATAAVAAGLVAMVLLLMPGPGQQRSPVPGGSRTMPLFLVRGQVLRVGGPEGTQPQGLPGDVTAHGPHDAAVQVRTSGGGTFTLHLEPGRWQLSATSSQYFNATVPCVAQVVVPTVKPVTIACHIK